MKRFILMMMLLVACGGEVSFTPNIPPEETRWRGNIMDSVLYRDDFLREVECLDANGYIRILDTTPFILVVSTKNFTCGKNTNSEGCFDNATNTVWISTQYGDDHIAVRHETIHWAGYDESWHDRGPFITCNPFFME